MCAYSPQGVNVQILNISVCLHRKCKFLRILEILLGSVGLLRRKHCVSVCYCSSFVCLVLSFYVFDQRHFGRSLICFGICVVRTLVRYSSFIFEFDRRTKKDSEAETTSGQFWQTSVVHFSALIGILNMNIRIHCALVSANPKHWHFPQSGLFSRCRGDTITEIEGSVAAHCIMSIDN